MRIALLHQVTLRDSLTGEYCFTRWSWLHLCELNRRNSVVKHTDYHITDTRHHTVFGISSNKIQTIFCYT